MIYVRSLQLAIFGSNRAYSPAYKMIKNPADMNELTGERKREKFTTNEHIGPSSTASTGKVRAVLRHFDLSGHSGAYNMPAAPISPTPAIRRSFVSEPYTAVFFPPVQHSAPHPPRKIIKEIEQVPTMVITEFEC